MKTITRFVFLRRLSILIDVNCPAQQIGKTMPTLRRSQWRPAVGIKCLGNRVWPRFSRHLPFPYDDDDDDDGSGGRNFNPREEKKSPRGSFWSITYPKSPHPEYDGDTLALTAQYGLVEMSVSHLRSTTWGLAEVSFLVNPCCCVLIERVHRSRWCRENAIERDYILERNSFSLDEGAFFELYVLWFWISHL